MKLEHEERKRLRDEAARRRGTGRSWQHGVTFSDRSARNERVPREAKTG